MAEIRTSMSFRNRTAAELLLEEKKALPQNRDAFEMPAELRKAIFRTYTEKYSWLATSRLKPNTSDDSEEFGFDHSLRRILTVLTENLPPHLQNEVRTSIAIGSLPLKDANACCIHGSQGECVIAVNVGLHSLLCILNKLLLTRVEIVGGKFDLKGPREPIWDGEETKNAFHRAVRIFLQAEPQHFPWELLGPLGEERVGFLTILTYHGLQFVVAHELAHHVLRHHLAENFEKDFEFAADEWAFREVMKFASKMRSDMTIMQAITAVESLLIFLGFVDVTRGLANVSHPSSTERIARLRGKFSFHPKVYQIADCWTQVATSLARD